MKQELLVLPDRNAAIKKCQHIIVLCIYFHGIRQNIQPFCLKADLFCGILSLAVSSRESAKTNTTQIGH